MLFNSLDFAIFLPIVFLLYWFVAQKNLKIQNLLIVTASYVFYGWWDWRFLSLIIFSSILDYFIGIQIAKTKTICMRKLFLWLSICINLGFLGFFKYYNFFIDNFVQAFTFFGLEVKPNTLNIILPLGISFYTFQTLSYTIDVYKRKLKPTKDIISFLAFVSFFPQLVAGPIERASHLLPQFYKKREFHYSKAVNGCKQILWGLIKKVVIADNCAYYANIIFTDYQDFNASTLFLGALFFAFQIYGDFSGYSDIAIGTSRLFGFNLKQNFAFPYFSRDIAEFWRRWHISLSTWFRDYLYIPLGGSKVGTLAKVRNTFLIFVVSGFWHGANWTFIIWGFLNALFFLPLLLTNKNRINTSIVAQNSVLPNVKELFQMSSTFLLIVIMWIFFRAESISHALLYINKMCSLSLVSFPNIFPKWLIVTVILFMLVEWFGRRDQFAIETLLLKRSKVLKWAFYFMLIVLVFILKSETEQDFIYFQF